MNPNFERGFLSCLRLFLNMLKNFPNSSARFSDGRDKELPCKMGLGRSEAELRAIATVFYLDSYRLKMVFRGNFDMWAKKDQRFGWEARILDDKPKHSLNLRFCHESVRFRSPLRYPPVRKA